MRLRIAALPQVLSGGVKLRRALLFIFPLIAIFTGCYREPVPARETVPEGARIYLQDRGLKVAPALDAQIVDYVNLDRNALTNIDEIATLVNLKWLRLNDNRLAKLPDLKSLKSLRRIYLRGNQFTEVPETLKDLESLTDIELSSNPIKEIPRWLTEKTGLKNLSFNNTAITRLPDDLSAWENLQSLQLGDLRLSAEEMARIRKALPRVAIVF